MNTPSAAPSDLSPTKERAEAIRESLLQWPSWTLNSRQLCDLELLAVGAFAPLPGFLGRADVASVVERMRLADGFFWAVPVTLDVDRATAEQAAARGGLALRDAEGAVLAVVVAPEVWEPERDFEIEAVYGTLDPAHAGVRRELELAQPCRVAGRLEVLRLPAAFGFSDLRSSPAQLRAEFAERGWKRVVAFQTRNPMHRAHFELTLEAARAIDGHLLIHPAVGETMAGDVDAATRIRCLRALLPRYPSGLARLALLPLAMRMAGPREALLHARIRANYGCTHFIVGRDHAGPAPRPGGRPFYAPEAARELALAHEVELGVTILAFEERVYVEGEDRFLPESEALAGPTARSIVRLSGSELRRRLDAGVEIPEWFTYPEVAVELRRRSRPRRHRGFTVLFTGLPSSGKSTVAKALAARLEEIDDRTVTLLDGDIVRRHLTSELGFSREHRDLNVRRIGYVAAQVARAGGVALCAPIAPYAAVRREVRAMAEEAGGFVLVFVATPLAVCEGRDPKGLYARARAGTLQGFTGVSDPYEIPTDAELALDASRQSPEEMAEAIVRHLQHEGFLASPVPETATPALRQ